MSIAIVVWAVEDCGLRWLLLHGRVSIVAQTSLVGIKIRLHR